MTRKIIVASGPQRDSARYVTIHTTPEEYGYRLAKSLSSGDREVYAFSPPDYLKLDPKDEKKSAGQISIEFSAVPGRPLYTGPPILHDETAPKARSLKHGHPFPDLQTPNGIPDASYRITTTERQIHRRYSQKTTYYVYQGTDNKYFFLIEEIEDILSAYPESFLHSETTGFIETEDLEVEEAAALLLHSAWRYERFFWGLSKFDRILQDGLLEARETHWTADIAFGRKKVHFAPYGP